MNAFTTIEVDFFSAEPHNSLEWSLRGWAVVDGKSIGRAHLELNGVIVAPLAYGWPRADVIVPLAKRQPSDQIGFTGHWFCSAPLSVGIQNFELVFFDADDLEAARTVHSVNILQGSTAYPKPAVSPCIQSDHSQAPYLNLLEKTLLGLPYVQGVTMMRRLDGRDWPEFAHSMVGLERLRNVRACAETVLRDKVPGDFIETGVWRGGTCIMLRGILSAFADTARKVWVADSFEGLPPPNPEKYPADLGDTLFEFKELAVPLEQVKQNFQRYGLLDDQVQFLKGFFSDSLPNAPIERLAVLRLDGDMYESTMDALTALYPKLSPGGFCIVDDYGAIAACRQAVNDYRNLHGISSPISMVDWTGAWWRCA